MQHKHTFLASHLYLLKFLWIRKCLLTIYRLYIYQNSNDRWTHRNHILIHILIRLLFFSHGKFGHFRNTGKYGKSFYVITLYLTIPIYTYMHIFPGVAFIIKRETGYSLLVDVFVGWLTNCCAQYTQMRHTCWVVLSVWWKYPWEHVTNVW